MRKLSLRSFARSKTMWLSFVFLTLFSTRSLAIAFYYGNIGWQRVSLERPLGGDSVAVQFNVFQSREWGFDDSPVVGDIRSGGNLEFGDGSPFAPVMLTVTSINASENFYFSEYTTTHIYPSESDFVAYIESSAKASFLVNNLNGAFKISTGVKLSDPANKFSPTVTVPTKIPVDLNLTVVNPLLNFFDIDATDADGDGLFYTLTPNGTFGSGGTQPGTRLSVNNSTGVMTFDRTGASGGQFYNGNITITDARGAYVMVDFIIKIVACTTPKPAPVFISPTPANGTTFTVAELSPVNFTVASTDNTPGGAFNKLTVISQPVGATTTPSLASNGITSYIDATLPPPSNKIQSVFNWIPQLGQYGSYQVSFEASDGCEQLTKTVVNIRVLRLPFKPKINTAIPTCIPTGEEISRVFTSTDPDPDDALTLSATGTVPAGMVFTPALPVASPTNMVVTTMDWTPTNANWGNNTLTLSVTDGLTAPQAQAFSFLVNDAPVINAGFAPPSGTQGVPYSYSFTVTDPNTAVGDIISVLSSTLPAGLSTSVSGNNVTISGTPTAAGTTAASITVKDTYGSQCGTDTETWSFLIKAPTTPTCTLNVTAQATVAKCKDDKVNITTTVTGATAAVTYKWYKTSISSSNYITNTANLTNVAPGKTYIVTIVSGSCKDTASLAVGNPAKLDPSICFTAVLTKGACRENTVYKGYTDDAQKAKLTANATGGKAPYSYVWYKKTGSNSWSAISGGTTRVITVKPDYSTTYKVKITDANGCIVYEEVCVYVENVSCGCNGVSVYKYNCGRCYDKCVPKNSVWAYLCSGWCLGECGGCNWRTVDPGTLNNGSFTVTGNTSNGMALTTGGTGLTLGGGLTPAGDVSIDQMHVAAVKTVDPVMFENGVTVYPNPSNGPVNVVLQGFQPGKVSLRVVGMNGNAVDTRTINFSGKQMIVPVNLSNKAKGVYMVQAVSAEVTMTTKFMLQ